MIPFAYLIQQYLEAYMKNKETLKILCDIMKSVGLYQVEKFYSRSFKIETKSTDIDMVTEVDKQSEDMLISRLSEAFPQTGFLAEESSDRNDTQDYIWVIDPLDGTTNFSTGIPIFAISVGLTYKGQTILGAVYHPILDHMYTGIKDQGAFKNQEAIQVNMSKTLRSSVLATGFPYDRAENPVNNIDEFARIAPKVKGIRRLGVAAYDLCLVAEGVFAGYWEYGLKPWDYTAGLLIASEAGAKYKKLEDREGSMIVSNPYIFDLIVQNVKK